MGTEVWFPCEWKYLGPRPFSRRASFYLSIFILVLIAFNAFWLASPSTLLAAPLFALPPLLSYFMATSQRKDSYLYRDWKNLPYVGDYSVAREHLFLSVPSMSLSYVKPRTLTRINGRTFGVKGKWPWQAYRVILLDESESSRFLQSLATLGVEQSD